MKTNFKGIKIDKDEPTRIRFNNIIIDVTHFEEDREKAIDVSKNIVEYFEVRQQIPFDLPELLEQRNEAFRLLEMFIDPETETYATIEGLQDYRNQIKKLLDKIQDNE